MGNREALLEAAVLCLRERGYGQTTARDVAGAAGVSLGAIRYHFGSLETLLNEAIAECSRRWIREFRHSLAARAGTRPQPGPLAAVEEIYKVFADEQTLLLGYVEAFARAQRSPRARAQLAGHYDELRAGVGAAVRDVLEADHTASDTIATILIALVDGLMIQWLLDPNRRLDPATLRHTTASLVASITSHT